MNWQPIDTAPKDGTPFLAYDSHRQAMFVAKWHHNYSDNPADGYWSNIVGDDDTCHPTHWMPLPKAPK